MPTQLGCNSDGTSAHRDRTSDIAAESNSIKLSFARHATGKVASTIAKPLASPDLVYGMVPYDCHSVPSRSRIASAAETNRSR
ncbi:hypothetical protein Enr13x_47750 [Stieleria neptunia]|uniref:Uncharacterized protein n=1 Tax=Stieleria neptunia TaxID=2527979 RepID=A0A518HVV9_9BACT|nr:hypothetical protein Enr13x_47750 [Stieleria neptunia]